jgi:hypothetical protein
LIVEVADMKCEDLSQQKKVNVVQEKVMLAYFGSLISLKGSLVWLLIQF